MEQVTNYDYLNIYKYAIEEFKYSSFACSQVVERYFVQGDREKKKYDSYEDAENRRNEILKE